MKKHALGARGRLALLSSIAVLFAAAGCAPAAESGETTTESSDSSTEQVVLEFAQLWAPELPDGSFSALMD